MSALTKGSSLYSKTFLRGPRRAASLNAAFTASTDGVFFIIPVKSVTDPSGIGTRIAIPSNFPCIFLSTNPVALAAPVLVGIIFTAAARALLKSLWGPSTIA